MGIALADDLYRLNRAADLPAFGDGLDHQLRLFAVADGVELRNLAL
jgi:hypothetical protein